MNYTARINISEIEFYFIRSRGPGGQHVNKTNSAAVLKWNIFETKSFSENEKEILRYKLNNKITKEGFLLIRSEEFRDQEQNKRKCFEKLEDILLAAFFKAKPRKKTKISRSVREKRFKEKKKRSEMKKSRQQKY